MFFDDITGVEVDLKGVLAARQKNYNDDMEQKYTRRERSKSVGKEQEKGQ